MFNVGTYFGSDFGAASKSGLRPLRIRNTDGFAPVYTVRTAISVDAIHALQLNRKFENSSTARIMS